MSINLQIPKTNIRVYKHIICIQKKVDTIQHLQIRKKYSYIFVALQISQVNVYDKNANKVYHVITNQLLFLFISNSTVINNAGISIKFLLVKEKLIICSDWESTANKQFDCYYQSKCYQHKTFSSMLNGCTSSVGGKSPR